MIVEDDKYQYIRALYLEDDKLTRTVVCEHLESRLNSLYVAENGFEGLVLFKNYQPNVIITDLNMPIVSGIDFIKKVRLFDPNVPIIVTSVLCDVKSFQKSIELKVDKYILKPFSPSEILKAIDELNKQIVITHISENCVELENLDEEQLNALQLTMRNSFTSVIKELIGKGAPKTNVKLKNGFIVIYLYDNFLQYEYSLASNIFDRSFINSLRKSIYENNKMKIERVLTHSTGMNVCLEEIRISIEDSVEKFIFSVKKSRNKSNK